MHVLYIHHRALLLLVHHLPGNTHPSRMVNRHFHTTIVHPDPLHRHQTLPISDILHRVLLLLHHHHNNSNNHPILNHHRRQIIRNQPKTTPPQTEPHKRRQPRHSNALFSYNGPCSLQPCKFCDLLKCSCHRCTRCFRPIWESLRTNTFPNGNP